MALVADKRAKQLKRYRARIEAAKGFRKDENLDDLWRRMNDLYKGKHFPKHMSYDDAIAVNLCFSTINVIGPSVAVNYPNITVTATQPEQTDNAVILEGATNYWWRHYDALPEFQRAVKDFLIFGTGWIKNGWRFVEEDKPDPEGYKAAFDQAKSQADQAAVDNPDTAGNLPTDEEIAAGIPSTKRITVHDAPFVERCSIHDIFVDPEATSMNDLRWIAQRVVKTLDELKSSDGYKATAVASCKADGRVTDTWFAANPLKREDDDCKRVTVWEFYDLSDGTMSVFPETGDDFFVDPTPQPYVFGHPFTMLRNYDVPDQFYPMGELEALEPLQHELNAARTSMHNDRKQYRRAWLYRSDSFGKAGKAALMDDSDNRLIPVEGNDPFADIISPLPAQQINQGLYQDSQIIEQDISTISAANEYEHNVRRTATEAAIDQDTANARAADKLAKVEWAITQVARRMVQLGQQYMSEGQVAKIKGKSGQPYHFYFDRDDIQGEYDFEVQSGSTQPKNEMLRRQTAMQMLQAFAPIIQLGVIDVRKLVEHTLRDGFGVTNPEDYLAQQQAPGMGMPPGMQQQMGMPPGGPGGPGGPPPPDGGGGPPAVQGVPPELASQLQGQVGAPI